MGEMADLIRNQGLEASDEPNVVYEDLPGDNEDVSGYDPLDYGDDVDDLEDDGPDDVAEDVTNFASNFRNGPAVAEQKPQRQEPAPQRQPKEEKGNIHAKLRIVERENKIMQERFAQLLDAITNPKVPEVEEEEQEIVPFEQDPLTHMVSKLDRVAKQVDKQSNAQKQQQQKEQIGKALAKADDYTNQMVEKIGEENWQEAMEYLANVRIEDYLDRNPGKTRDEASNIIGAAVLREKISLAASGRDPAELYLKDAVRFGFRPSSLNQKEVAPVAPPKTAPRNAKDDIRNANARNANTRTTASMNGAPAKQKLSAKTVVGMKETDFRDLVDEVTKERGRNGSIKLSDFILPNS